MGLSRGYPNFYNCTVKGRKNEKDYDICRTFTKYFWDIPNLVSTVNNQAKLEMFKIICNSTTNAAILLIFSAYPGSQTFS